MALPPRVGRHFPLPACGERVRERGSCTGGPADSVGFKAWGLLSPALSSLGGRRGRSRRVFRGNSLNSTAVLLQWRRGSSTEVMVVSDKKRPGFPALPPTEVFALPTRASSGNSSCAN
jgi:hypothetical protein